MKYAELPDARVRPLPFYLAMEEYLARTTGDDLFFMWQVEPTVIFGRNQLIEREVDLDYCRAHGIAVYRRKSGGGCVYADMQNIMFSHITSSVNVQSTFSAYTARVASMLRGLGLDASATGRNDVLIGSRKVSGNAFYHIPGRSIVHGTMLFDTDMANMLRAISPSPAKLTAKGVESVRSHITTIAEHRGDLSIDSFKDYARNFMSDGVLRLGDADVEAIERLSRPYFDPSWIYGRHSGAASTRQVRIEGVGEFQVELAVAGNRIRHLNLAGDFFVVGDLDSLIGRLVGVDYNREAVAAALDSFDPAEVVAKLTIDDLTKLIF